MHPKDTHLDVLEPAAASHLLLRLRAFSQTKV